MDDQALVELEFALARFCDEVVSDVTLPTRDGLLRRVHWLHRGREFRASLLVPPEATTSRAPGRHASRLPRHLRLDQLSSRPIFEKRGGEGGWESALTVSMWHWMLRTAGRHAGDGGDGSPGDPAGRPVRPRPGRPSLRAGAAAVPDQPEDDSRRYRALPL